MASEGKSLIEELERSPCPQCGAMKIVPVVFGLPGGELMERARRGEVSLGGCMPQPGVLGACKACGHWRTTREGTESPRLTDP